MVNSRSKDKLITFSSTIVALLLITLSMGCSGPDEKATTAPKITRRVIRIGLIPEQNIFKQLERYEPVLQYVSDKADIDIKLKVLTRYGNVIDNFIAARIDGAFFGSFIYTMAHIRLGIHSLVRPEDLNGVSTYRGIILVRKDSGIKSLADMKGKRFAFVDQETSAGYLFPLKYFITHGVPRYKGYFGELYFAGTHEDVIHDILHNRADIGAAKNTIFERMSQENPQIKKYLQVLDLSPEFPENCLAVRWDMDDKIKNGLKSAFLNMSKDPKGIEILRNFGAKKFIETKNSDYAIVYQYAQDINKNILGHTLTNTQKIIPQ